MCVKLFVLFKLSDIRVYNYARILTRYFSVYLCVTVFSILNARGVCERRKKRI